MIITFEGVQGSGKTTAAVAYAYEDHTFDGRKVIANQHLNFEYQKFGLEWFIEHLADHEMEDCILLLDEMYQIADSRNSGSKLNRLFSYFMVQTRKRRVDVYFCTHHIDHIDLRLRRAADIRNSCRYYGEKPCRKCRCKPCGGSGKVGGLICEVCDGVGGTGLYLGKPCDRCKGYGELGFVRMHVLHRRKKRRFTPPDIFGNNYWHLFNSYDRIPMPAKAIQGIDTAEVF
jgi:hypothetical protein